MVEISVVRFGGICRWGTRLGGGCLPRNQSRRLRRRSGSTFAFEHLARLCVNHSVTDEENQQNQREEMNEHGSRWYGLTCSFCFTRSCKRPLVPQVIVRHRAANNRDDIRDK